LGQHVRKRRLELRLPQKQIAHRLGVNPWTVLNWEKGHTEPPVKSMPAILRFLGYDPFPEPKSLPERLLAKRRAMGWSIRKAAGTLGVDPGIWRDWEQGKVILRRNHRGLVAQLLGLPIKGLDHEMRARWNCSHNSEQ
jgi:transcriptional regulator with XRE-family HTH domain